MLVLGTYAGPAACHALHFAKDILGADAAAFYTVDGELNPRDFLLVEVPFDFHRQYVQRMCRLDPLHPRHAGARQVARLGDVFDRAPTPEAAAYRAFSAEFGISDMAELFFRRQDRVVAGICAVWGGGRTISADAMHLAGKIHDYLEFNLASDAELAAEDTARFGLTARELDVVGLLCCGRTNREIGECLDISLATVKTHLTHIFEKLGVETRSAVVAKMARLQ